MKKLLHMPRLNLEKSLALGAFALVHQINGNFDGGNSRSFSIAALKHPELAFLYVHLKLLDIFQELGVRLWKHFFHLRNGLRCANTSHNILALGVNKIFTIHDFLAC
eukprot:CCRYP_020924-RF/>CCRYP_020924-RF protein AED:0.48 eAED:1.00 QI:0/0/0/1/0/0/2/0/106